MAAYNVPVETKELAPLETAKERRRRKRIAAEKGALAFHGDHYGQIVDISRDGLSFHYSLEGEQTKTWEVPKNLPALTLDIVYLPRDFALDDLPVRVVADYKIISEPIDASPITHRQRILTFEHLTADQIYGLQRFLQLIEKEGATILSPPALGKGKI